MPELKFNDRELLRLIDKEKLSQSAAAKRLGVSRQAVNLRLQQLRGKTTKAVVVKKVEECIDQKLDAMAQLHKINSRANELLDKIEDDPALAVKVMAEIRGQLKLQLEIFQALYDLTAAQEFQEEILKTIGEVSPDVRTKIIHKLNEKRAIRSAVRFTESTVR